MDLLKLKFYIEVLAISVGIVLVVAVLPIQTFILGEVRGLTVFLGTFLWYTILFHNITFQELKEKWFRR